MSLDQSNYQKIIESLRKEAESDSILKLIPFIPEEIKRKELRTILKEAIDDGDIKLAQTAAEQLGRKLLTEDLLDIIESIRGWGIESCEYEVEVANLLPEPKRTEVITEILLRESEILGSEIKARHEATISIGKPSEPKDYLPEVEERIEDGMVDLAIEFLQLFGRDQMPKETLDRVRKKVLEEDFSYLIVKDFLEACGEEPTKEIKERVLERYLKKEDSFRKVEEICEILDYRPLTRKEALQILESTKKIKRPTFERDEIQAIVKILEKSE